MSASILDILNLRLILVGGSCAKTHYRKIPCPGRRTLSVPLIPGMMLEVDLEFSGQSLRRIVAFTDHPSAIYLANTADSTAISLKLEAASNFLLWLLGRPHDPIAIQRLAREKTFRHFAAAPFVEMRRYLRIEKSSKRVLSPGEYDKSFLSWAKTILVNKFHALVENQESVAAACAKEMDNRALAARKRKYYENWHGSRPAKKLRDEDTLDQDNRNPSSTEPAIEGQERAHIRPTYEEHRAQLNRQINHKRYGNVIREFWDGHEVKAQSNGTVRIFVASSQRALQFRASGTAMKKIRTNSSQPSIHFTANRVTVMVAGEVVYQKPVPALTSGKDGKAWKEQIEKELARKT